MMSHAIDPRPARINKTLQNVRRIISIVSGKGGAGKTTISVLMALALRDEGRRVGLLDLDFFGPNCHVLLGISEFGYKEEKGIEPYIVDNIKFVSIVPFIGDKYVAMRGEELTNALIELLSIINWGELDYLIIDMPPGMGDTLIEILKIMPRLDNITVSTSSPLAIETVRRLILYLKDNNYKILGLIENMVRNSPRLEKLAEKLNINFLGALPFDPNLEERIGNRDLLRESIIYKNMKKTIIASL